MELTAHIPDEGSAGRGLPPELRRQVDELHGLVRRWAEVGSRTGAVPTLVSGNPTAVYVDLMFAYGLARLGEVQRAIELADAASAAMETYPDELDKGIVGRFLARVFRYRIDQVAAGHSGGLSPALLDELDELDKKSEGKANSPPGIAHFMIIRMRQHSRILEPYERPDPYKKFTAEREGGLKKELHELVAYRDPERLAALIRNLYRREEAGDSPQGTPSVTERQFDVLRDCLPLAGRVGADFAAELIRLIPDALRQSFPKQKDVLVKQSDLLERGLFLAAHFAHRELTGKLVDAFTELLATKADDDRLELVNRATGSCVRCLRKLNLRDDLDKLLQRLHTAVLGQGSLTDLKANYSGRPEQRMKALQTLLSIAGGWLVYGLTDQANPILDEARSELLSPPAKGKTALHDATCLATAYIAAVSQGPTEGGFQRIAELFRRIKVNKITNSFTSAPFYSRLHLTVAEEVVLAILEMLPPSSSLVSS